MPLARLTRSQRIKDGLINLIKQNFPGRKGQKRYKLPSFPYGVKEHRKRTYEIVRFFMIY
jgi:hypothetical protein